MRKLIPEMDFLLCLGLRSVDNTFVKAALAFDFQLLESIPYEEHDLKPDYIITQTQFIRREN